MSLSTLVGGADCGPGNALQGLTKRFDGDRGVHLDLYRSGPGGSSKEAFRTHPADPSPHIGQEAAAFFHGNDTLPRPSAQPFDLAPLNAALASSIRHNIAHHPHTASPLHTWSSDFNSGHHSAASSPQISSHPLHKSATSAWATDFTAHHVSTPLSGTPLHGPSPLVGNIAMHPMHHHHIQPLHLPASPLPTYLNQGITPIHSPLIRTNEDWSSHFSQVENHAQSHIGDSKTTEIRNEIFTEDLATTAGLLVESLKHETSSKFQNSAFMGLMRQLRDKEIVVEGNDMVAASNVKNWASDFSPQDLKGKGRELPAFQTRRKSVHFQEGGLPTSVPMVTPDDFQDWADEPVLDGPSASSRQDGMDVFGAQNAEWNNLQKDWEEFEASGHGFRPSMTKYEFQPHNPYLLGGSSQSYAVGSAMYQSVLEREAAVQRNPFDAHAWYELGVKQQENEREAKAIDALTRALELDPNSLAAWLALAISHTNENNSLEAHNAIRQWISQNEKYRIASVRHLTQSPEAFAASSSRHEILIQCLMDMARLTPEGEIDADIQIALAVLLNSSEEYEKAQDCFRAALEVRPEDWLLYNRVGATLANSGNAEEALLFYQRALELNPTYIRARFNMGISCINLGRNEEAASHILDALVLQEEDNTGGSPGSSDASGRGVVASALWDTLRTASLYMQRHDLAALCEPSQRDLTRYRLELQNISQA